MPVQPLPGFSVPGYTNMNVIGSQSLMAEILPVTLASGDVTLTKEQAASIGIIEVSVGHATNAIVVAVANAVPGSMFIVSNADASLAANIKVAGGTAVTVAATKSALVYVTSAGQFKRLTADA